MPTPLRALIVEDSPDDAELLLLELERGGYQVSSKRVDTAAAMDAALASQHWDLIVSDYEMPRFSAPEALARLHRSGLDVPFVIVSGVVGEEVAVAALKAGAHDFIPKGRLTRLLPAIQRELEDADQRRQRKQAEANLRASEQRYRSLFESAGSVIISLAPDGRILEWNPEAERVYGWTRQELLGRNYFDLLPSDIRPLVVADVRKVMDGEETRDFENAVRTKRGAERMLSWNVTPLLDSRGKSIGVTAIGQDITARKQAEAAREDEAQIARALARVGQEMVSSLDTPLLLNLLCQVTAEVVGCDLSHVFLLKPREKVYEVTAGHGNTPEEWEEFRLLKFPAAAFAEQAAELDRDRLLDLESSSLIEATGVREVAAVYNVRAVMLVGLRRGGELIGALTAGYRGTAASFNPKQRRMMQGIAQLASLALENSRLFSNLDQANRLKSEFVATMSHELRTPLNIIIGYQDLLLEQSFGSMTAERADAVQRAQRSAGELLALINGILDLSRLEVGQVPVELQTVSVAELASDVVVAARAGCEKTDLAIVSTVPADIPALRTDRMKLLVVLRNLVSNGVKFTVRGRVSVGAESRDGGVEISVSDTGVGIDAAVLPIIFEPFRQGDASMTRRFGGVGLGLYVVRRLVDVLGCRISVESEVGKGSTFRVWIPSAASAPPES